MEKPKLSLIIPVYNKAPFLRRCLDSVAKQMREDVQVIVIDDASTDGSDKIMLEYSEFDRIYLLENGGVSAARNEGLEYAKADAVAFLDADDALLPFALQNMVAYAERVDKWPIIQFGQKRINSNGDVHYSNAMKGSYERTGLPKHWQMVWNKVYSLELIREHSVRFREDMYFGEDELFNVDLLECVPKIWHTPHTLVAHHMDDMNSICRGGSVNCKACQKLDDAYTKKIEACEDKEWRDWMTHRRSYLRSCKMFKDAGYITKGTGKRDIVYLLREGKNEELVYSLRSVEENFAYRRVWFAGGKPDGLEPDEYMPIKQDAPSKWQNVRNMLVEVCKNDNISKDFWLFNDDFFVLEPCDDKLPTFYWKTLDDWIEHCKNAAEYAGRLRHLKKTLEDAGLPIVNYALHVPMLINRKKALEVLEKYPDEPMFRALYGNYVGLNGVEMADYKLRRMDKKIEPGHIFVSTQDDSFHSGIVGRQLRDRFKYKSRFEV